MKDKLERIRTLLRQANLGGYIVPTTDEFMSEYAPPATRRFDYITNFSCSNGYLIIFLEKAILFTDTRYLTAAKFFFEKDLVEVEDYAKIPSYDFSSFLNTSQKSGYCPKFFTKTTLDFFKTLDLEESEEFVDKIWKEKPPFPSGKASYYPLEYSGENENDKIEKVRTIIKQKDCEAALITSSESVCWLLNLRSSDSSHSPIMLSYLYIDFEKLVLFTENREFEEASCHPEFISGSKNVMQKQVQHNINLLVQKPLSELEAFAKTIDKKILLPKYSSVYLANLFSDEKKKIEDDPISLLKARKNKAEIQSAKNVHLKDAVALIEFFAWFEEHGIGLDEYELGIKLTSFRAKQDLYICDSFEPIVGFQENGAKIHYKAQKNTAKIVEGTGILLIDSGGHYYGGTTDVTRTINLGAASKTVKKYYTKVLKGHIALAKIKFPKGVNGAHLDVLARQFLWNDGEDYAHGTGHGVGNCLSVHEGPTGISLYNSKYKLEEGMILSNEPGFYKEGEFGIRIENLQFIKQSEFTNFLEFEQLTLAPYCKDLILFDVLAEDELTYLKEYYKRIESIISPFLSTKARAYVGYHLKL